MALPSPDQVDLHSQTSWPVNAREAALELLSRVDTLNPVEQEMLVRACHRLVEKMDWRLNPSMQDVVPSMLDTVMDIEYKRASDHLKRLPKGPKGHEDREYFKRVREAATPKKDRGRRYCDYRASLLQELSSSEFRPNPDDPSDQAKTLLERLGKDRALRATAWRSFADQYYPKTKSAPQVEATS